MPEYSIGEGAKAALADGLLTPTSDEVYYSHPSGNKISVVDATTQEDIPQPVLVVSRYDAVSGQWNTHRAYIALVADGVG